MKRTAEQVLVEWLIVNAQLKDSDALEQLVKIYYPKLLRYSQRQLGHTESARDVVQMTLEIMCRDLYRLKDPTAFPGWIYQVLHRRGVDWIRSRQRQRRFQDQAACLMQESEAQCSNREQDLLTLERILGQLSPDAYQVIHLFYLEGLSLQEISQVLSLPVGTVKSRLFNARKQMQIRGNNDD